MARLALTARLAFALVLTGLVAAPVAEATWPGQNGGIYFVCRAVGAPFGSEDICAIKADGSGLANLTNTPDQREGTPSVSRDGRQLAFIRGQSADARLWAMNVDGSGARQLTDLQTDGPNWTPDNLQIAFRATTGDGHEFRLVAASGGATTAFALPSGAPAVTGTHQSPRYNAAGAYLYTRFAQIPGSAPPSFSEQAFVVRDGAEVQATPFAGSSNSFPS